MNRWIRKAEALARLVEDQRGKPEGDVARSKLAEIIRKHPEVAIHPPVVKLAQRVITLKDLGKLKKAGVDITGSWEGATPWEAFAEMEAHYRDLLARTFGVPKEVLDAKEVSRATAREDAAYTGFTAASGLGTDDDTD